MTKAHSPTPIADAKAEPPTLRGKHIVLEPLQEGNASELWDAANERGLWDYMTFDVRSVEDLRQWIGLRVAARDAGTALPFLIRVIGSTDGTRAMASTDWARAEGRAIGSTSIFDISPHRTMEVGHTWLGAAVRRSAVNTECKRLVLGHCFESMRAIRVQLKCDERNMPSRRAIERLGAVYEGTIRNQMTLADGHRRNARVYSILDTEWPAIRNRLDATLKV